MIAIYGYFDYIKNFFKVNLNEIAVGLILLLMFLIVCIDCVLVINFIINYKIFFT